MSDEIVLSGTPLTRKRTARRAMLGVALTLAALMVLWLSASPASAEVDPNFYEELTPLQQKAVTNFLYEQSPQGTVPYTEEAATEESEALSEAYEEVPESQPTLFAFIVGGVNSTTVRTGLLKKLAEFVPKVAAEGTAFSTGFLIGEGVNAVFGRAGLLFGSAPEEKFLGTEGYEFCYSEACGGELDWHPHGSNIWYGATVQQEPGAYLYGGSLYRYGSPYGHWNPVIWDEPPCQFSYFSPPPYAGLGVSLSTGSHCYVGGEEYPDNVVYPYITEKKLLSLERLHHYNPLTDPEPEWRVEAPEDPGTVVVEEKAEEAIDESEELQAWLSATINPETRDEYFPAPAATERKVKDKERLCDRGSGPTFYNLDGNQGPEPFEVKEPTSFTVTDLPPGVESPSPVYLRWGRASWIGEEKGEPEFMDLWNGWGWRHIQAKHGWGPLDRIETEEALVRAQVPIPGNREGNWVYTTPVSTPGSEGAKCERWVVVEFEKGVDPETKAENPAPRGIVTSYNKVVP